MTERHVQAVGKKGDEQVRLDPIRALAGLTFTLYLFHYPLVYALRALVLATGLEHFSPLIVTGGTLALVALIAPITEAQKGPLRRLMVRLTSRAERPAT